MSKIDYFKTAKRDVAEAKTWAGKIGDKYYGGTSGKGELGSIVKAQVALTVYHQYSDGDKNYHDSPAGLNEALQAVIKRHHAALIEEAIADLELKAEAAAKLAVAEHAALLTEAGLAA